MNWFRRHPVLLPEFLRRPLQGLRAGNDTSSASYTGPVRLTSVPAARRSPNLCGHLPEVPQVMGHRSRPHRVDRSLQEYTRCGSRNSDSTETRSPPGTPTRATASRNRPTVARSRPASSRNSARPRTSSYSKNRDPNTPVERPSTSAIRDEVARPGNLLRTVPATSTFLIVVPASWRPPHIKRNVIYDATSHVTRFPPSAPSPYPSPLRHPLPRLPVPP